MLGETDIFSRMTKVAKTERALRLWHDERRACARFRYQGSCYPRSQNRDLGHRGGHPAGADSLTSAQNFCCIKISRSLFRRCEKSGLM